MSISDINNLTPDAGRQYLLQNSGFGGAPVSSLTGDKGKTEREKLEILAHEFESVFLNQMIKTMRKTIDKSNLIDGGSAERIYTDLLDETLSRDMAFSQKGGLASELVDQLSGQLEDGKRQNNEKEKG